MSGPPGLPALAMRRLDAVNRTVETGVLAVITDRDEAARRSLVEACVAGGVELVEVDRAQEDIGTFEALASWAQSAAPAAILGAGPVAAPREVEDLAEAGARFIRTTDASPELAAACHSVRVAYYPTCHAGPEVFQARTNGAEIVTLAGDGDPCSPEGLREALDLYRGSLLIAPACREPAESCIEALAAEGAASIRVVVRGEPERRPEAVSRWLQKLKSSVSRGRGEPLYGPVEHTGVYPKPESSVDAIVDWYRAAFAYPVRTAKTAYLGAGVFGRIEVVGNPVGEPCHLGIRVRDFEEAVDDLEKRGYALEEPVVSLVSRLAYLKDRDPAGNLVHIIWRP